MPYFTRLTDIVTCSLTEILAEADDPERTLRDVIAEMEEGLAAARRSARTAAGNETRLEREIDDHEQQIVGWLDQARDALKNGREDEARAALVRKVEIEDLVEGLRPELEAARRTREHMQRIQKALEARFREAVRRLSELTGDTPSVDQQQDAPDQTILQPRPDREQEVEAELEALRRQLDT